MEDGKTCSTLRIQIQTKLELEIFTEKEYFGRRRRRLEDNIQSDLKRVRYADTLILIS
jgi:hypothetical protein